MNLAAIFDADEHANLAEPYVRAMRFRKWAIMAAVAAMAVHQPYLVPKAFSIGVATVTLPRAVWVVATVVGLSWATFHFVLLMTQLVSRYPMVFRARIWADRHDDLQQLEEKAIRLRQELGAIKSRQIERQATTVGSKAPAVAPGKSYELWDADMAKMLEKGIERSIARHSEIEDETDVPPAFAISELLMDAARFVGPAILLIIAWWSVF